MIYGVADAYMLNYHIVFDKESKPKEFEVPRAHPPVRPVRLYFNVSVYKTFYNTGPEHEVKVNLVAERQYKFLWWRFWIVSKVQSINATKQLDMPIRLSDITKMVDDCIFPWNVNWRNTTTMNWVRELLVDGFKVYDEAFATLQKHD